MDFKNLAILFVCWIICAFGQPAFSSLLASVAAAIGYAGIFSVLLKLPHFKHRFFWGSTWYAAVLAVQFGWLLSHPYSYIYFVYLLMIAFLGMQFGLLSYWITPNLMARRGRWLVIPALWVLLEWSRLFVLSGITWNPVGLALAGNVYTLQTAALFGVYGMSFWVILSSVLWVRGSYLAWSGAVVLPYLFGWSHLTYHDSQLQQTSKQLTALLVQPAFPAEELTSLVNKKPFIEMVQDEWGHLLKITAAHRHQSFDLVVFPEAVVPIATYSYAFPYKQAVQLFTQHYQDTAKLPEPIPPFGDRLVLQDGSSQQWVNNAFFAQALANYFDASVVIGLEDASYTSAGDLEIYSSALHFKPQISSEQAWPPAERYEKRVLLPMGEYIPWAWLANLAKNYGIVASFTPGQSAKIFRCKDTALSPSICYEETFGDITREGSAQGAEVIVNLTSDIWYPNSMLTHQHLEHSRLRTVEGGLPLLRACNTGVTCAIDSLGRTVSELGQGLSNQEEIAAGLPVNIKLYRYSTLYAFFGDRLILGFTFFICVCFLIRAMCRKKNFSFC